LNLGRLAAGGGIAAYALTILQLCAGIIGKTFRARPQLIKYATPGKDARQQKYPIHELASALGIY
jgi:hypothetical protein